MSRENAGAAMMSASLKAAVLAGATKIDNKDAQWILDYVRELELTIVKLNEEQFNGVHGSGSSIPGESGEEST